jgi:hypothetical protein
MLDQTTPKRKWRKKKRRQGRITISLRRKSVLGEKRHGPRFFWTV